MTTDTHSAHAQPADVEPITLAVGGMTCAGCATTIQRGLSQIAGVEGADVNVATRRATVLPDGTFDPAELELAMRAAITGLGYQVLTPERAADAPQAGHEHGAGHEHSSHENRGHDHAMERASEHEAHLHADA